MDIFRPTLRLWNIILSDTEIYFEGIDDVPYSRVECINFDGSKIHLKSGKRIPFDGLSKTKYCALQQKFKMSFVADEPPK